LALCINAKAGGYDFFMFYFTLCITPMTFLSGAFFPRTQLPAMAQMVADVLPLSLLVDVIRAVFQHSLGSALPQVGGLVGYTVVSVTLAVYLSRKRFEKS
jgi:lipooligosaccharide transport system permease protein